MKKNVALFGLGRIGLMHAKNIIQNSRLRLKYIFDINQKISKVYSKKLKCIYIKNPSYTVTLNTLAFLKLFLKENLKLFLLL